MEPEGSPEVRILTDNRKLRIVTVNWCLLGLGTWSGSIQSDVFEIPQARVRCQLHVTSSPSKFLFRIVDLRNTGLGRAAQAYLVHEGKEKFRIPNPQDSTFQCSVQQIEQYTKNGTLTLSCDIPTSGSDDERGDLTDEISLRYLTDNLMKFFENPPEDVTLISSDGFKSSMNRIVVSALSQKFSKLLADGQKEIVLENCDTRSLTAIVDFLQGREIKDIESVAEKLLLIPHDIDKLRRMCEDALLETVTPATISQVFDFGAKIESERIKTGCLDLLILDRQYASVQDKFLDTFATNRPLVEECLRAFDRCLSSLTIAERIALPRDMTGVQLRGGQALKLLIVTRRLAPYTIPLSWTVDDLTWQEGEYFESKRMDMPRHPQVSYHTSLQVTDGDLKLSIAFKPFSFVTEKIEVFIRDSANFLHPLSAKPFPSHEFIASDILEKNALRGKRSLAFLIRLTLPGKLKHYQFRRDYLDRTPAEKVRLDSLIKYFSTTERDITLSGREGFSVYAHRTILMAHSSVFRRMFEDEQWLESKTNHIAVEDCDNETLDSMVKFMHGDPVTHWTSKALKLLVLADRYDIVSLRSVCEGCISANISHENVVDTLIVADEIKSLGLRRQCLEFICSGSLGYKVRIRIVNALMNKPDLLNEFLDSFMTIQRLQSVVTGNEQGNSQSAA